MTDELLKFFVLFFVIVEPISLIPLFAALVEEVVAVADGPICEVDVVPPQPGDLAAPLLSNFNV